ncbi:MAG: metalloregulator ArsR/SmtB family transcription factor [Caldimonas sp.]
MAWSLCAYRVNWFPGRQRQNPVERSSSFAWLMNRLSGGPTRRQIHQIHADAERVIEALSGKMVSTRLPRVPISSTCAASGSHCSSRFRVLLPSGRIASTRSYLPVGSASTSVQQSNARIRLPRMAYGSSQLTPPISSYNMAVMDQSSYRRATSDRLDLTFAALADPTRRAILARLTSGDASVNELAKPFSMSQPAVSRHLKVLEHAGLISSGSEAQRRPRRLEARPLAEATAWLETYREYWEASFVRLDNLLSELKATKRKSKHAAPTKR